MSRSLIHAGQQIDFIRFDEISSQLIENEVGRGGVNAEDAARRLWSEFSGPGPEWTTEKPPRIPPPSPVSSPQTTHVLPLGGGEIVRVSRGLPVLH